MSTTQLDSSDSDETSSAQGSFRRTVEISLLGGPWSDHGGGLGTPAEASSGASFWREILQRPQDGTKKNP